ncbi:hypothetical protein NQ318_022609 [Aromia moschata]|uniref:MADF domain-containing protein n=1 Tax=Aromia moschata TaxID=1265417 RepID=A0AAV8XCK5_9CUCU|nr:hypothetical protein NQ318_022609 [Aromia moschata]
MDVEKLINIIYEKKPLWDMTDKSYHMRDIQRKLWQEVATEMSGQVDELKTKWRGLRDTFRKEFNKSKKQKSGDGAESVVTSKWAYYKMLLFLSKTVERRKLHGNVSPQKENDNKSDSETESTLEEKKSDSKRMKSDDRRMNDDGRRTVRRQNDDDRRTVRRQKGERKSDGWRTNGGDRRTVRRQKGERNSDGKRTNGGDRRTVRRRKGESNSDGKRTNDDDKRTETRRRGVIRKFASLNK